MAAMKAHHPAPLLTGIIGYPVRHSVSPAFQQAAFDHLCLNILYKLWETPPEHLAPRFLELHRPGILGANVTVPHKENAIKLVDEVDDFARRIGAINTIVNRAGRLTGHNTDGPGFLRALAEDGGMDPAGKRALLLGAGGSARAVSFALLRGGAASITIANRTEARAAALTAALRGEAPSISATMIATVPWGSPVNDVDLVVNTTTLGMRHGPGEGQSPLKAGVIPPAILVCDLVYNPQETPLLAEARRAGARTLGGLPMLIYQGAIAFEMWTGQRPPIGVMFEAARRAL